MDRSRSRRRAVRSNAYGAPRVGRRRLVVRPDRRSGRRAAPWPGVVADRAGAPRRYHSVGHRSPRVGWPAPKIDTLLRIADALDCELATSFERGSCHVSCHVDPPSCILSQTCYIADMRYDEDRLERLERTVAELRERVTRLEGPATDASPARAETAKPPSRPAAPGTPPRPPRPAAAQPRPTRSLRDSSTSRSSSAAVSSPGREASPCLPASSCSSPPRVRRGWIASRRELPLRTRARRCFSRSGSISTSGEADTGVARGLAAR